jgi:hypothetical protein
MSAIRNGNKSPASDAHQDHCARFGHDLLDPRCQIDDPAVKQALMLRAHEAMGGSIAQGNLATDRMDAFIAEKRSAGTATPPPRQSVAMW